MKTIFISKNEDEITVLKEFCIVSNLKLIAQSGIRFEIVPFKDNASYEVLFFGSKQSVRAYFEQHIPKADVHFACAGETTARTLKAFGFESSFTATVVNDSEIKAFAKWVNERTVFFPSSDQSLQSFSKYLDAKEYLFAISYKTIYQKISSTALNVDVHIFTSPSNVKSFAKLFVNSELDSVIAWGESTAKTIEEILICKQLRTLKEPTFELLIQQLKNLLS